ncbi:MAG: peptide ABC transporter substrate-binding protein [Chloroflexota bacterium]|nr:peptide ABC transporter substrate-binding protein [Chloroflexota bacterium]
MRSSPVLLVLIAVLLGAAACATAPIPTYGPPPTGIPSATRPGSTPTATALPSRSARPRVLRINLDAHPDVLDPQRASSTAEIVVLQLAYEGLTRVDENGKVIPGAASKWEFSSDGKTLTFHLRDGLARADGTPLKAKDFEYAFKHAVDPRVGAYAQSFLDDVHGATAAYSLDPKSKPEDIGKALDNVGVKATDDTTLVITFDQPAGFWLTIASTWVGWPSDKSKEDTNPDAWWLKPENHNGNGPFKISEIQDQVIKLVPNLNYWGGKATLDRIEMYWISDPQAALDSYRKGDLDIVHLTSDNFVQAQSDSAVNKELVRAPAARVTYLGFNVKKAPFNDKNVRKAFSQALDRESFVRDVLKGLGKPYLSWIPPGTPGYDETATVPGYDPKAAVQTLIDSGFGTPDKKKVDCNKLGAIKLTYSNTPRTQFLFQFIAGSLTRVFPCQVLLDPIEPNAYPIAVRDPKTTPQVYLIPWEEEYPHPQDWLFLQTCSGVYASRIGYCNRDFDSALTAANQELDPDKAIDKYKAAQRIFIGDVPGAFLWNNENAYLIKPYVVGLWDHHSSADSVWPGQFGPVLSYDIDTSRVGAGYPAQ